MDHEQGGRVWTGLNLAVDWDQWQACIIVVKSVGSHKLQGSSWLMEALDVSGGTLLHETSAVYQCAKFLTCLDLYLDLV